MEKFLRVIRLTHMARQWLLEVTALFPLEARKMAALAGPQTKRINLVGRVVIPGVNDAHYHLFVRPTGFSLQFKRQDPTWQLRGIYPENRVEELVETRPSRLGRLTPFPDKCNPSNQHLSGYVTYRVLYVD